MSLKRRQGHAHRSTCERHANNLIGIDGSKLIDAKIELEQQHGHERAHQSEREMFAETTMMEESPLNVLSAVLVHSGELTLAIGLQEAARQAGWSPTGRNGGRRPRYLTGRDDLPFIL